MRDVLLVLLFFALALGGCAVTVSILQPTINTTASSWVQAEIRTDPVDDLVRFRKAERDGRAANILLPVFALLSAILLLLALATPLPHILKEMRLLRKKSQPHRRPAKHSQPWLEQPPSLPFDQLGQLGQQPATATPTLPEPAPPPLLSPPQSTTWLEE